jgi:hypothetical protein
MLRWTCTKQAPATLELRKVCNSRWLFLGLGSAGSPLAATEQDRAHPPAFAGTTTAPARAPMPSTGRTDLAALAAAGAAGREGPQQARQQVETEHGCDDDHGFHVGKHLLLHVHCPVLFSLVRHTATNPRPNRAALSAVRGRGPGFPARRDRRCRRVLRRAPPPRHRGSGRIRGEQPSRTAQHRSQSHRRKTPRRPVCAGQRGVSRGVAGEGFEPPKAEPSDLQSDPFGRSGNPPGPVCTRSTESVPNAVAAGAEGCPR